MRILRIGFCVFVLLAPGINPATRVRAQDAQPALHFEVATIKPSPSEACCAWWQANGRQLTVHSANLRWLIRWSFGLNDKQIVGSPELLDDHHYDVSGVIEGTKAPDDLQWKAAMQRLITDRFQMKVHHETRLMPAFALTVAKGGPKLTKSDPAKDTEPSLAFNGGSGQTINGHGEDVTLTQFMNEIQRIALDRPVVDHTGITGTYDLRLEFTREDSGMLGMTSLPDNAAPNLITALNQQLGLKLESVKAQVDVLVIDKADPPSAN